MSGQAEEARARALHEDLLQARRSHRQAEHRLATLLWALEVDRLYLALGYSSVSHYAEVVLDLMPRQSRDLVRIGRRLRALPRIEAAFAEGALGWTKVRELVRVAEPETEGEWLERALSTSSRELERQVAVTCRGEPPPPPDETLAPARVRMTFELEAADAEVVRRALASLRAQTETGPGDDEDEGVLLAAMARRLLADDGAVGDAPPERYRVVIMQCPSCERARVGEHEASAAVCGEAACDAEVVDLRFGPQRGRFERRVPPARRRTVMHRDGMRCAVPYCRATLWLDVHHIVARSCGGGNDEANLCTLCPAHHRLIHEGRLHVAREADGRLSFRHADGRRFGPMPHAPSEADDRSDLAGAALAALAAGPLPAWRIADRLERPLHRVAHLLAALEAAGDIVRLADGRYARREDVKARWERSGRPVEGAARRQPVAAASPGATTPSERKAPAVA